MAEQDTGVVDGLGKAELEDLGLKTTLQKVLDLNHKNSPVDD